MAWNIEREKEYQKDVQLLEVRGQERRIALGALRNALTGCRHASTSAPALEEMIERAPQLIRALLPWAPKHLEAVTLNEQVALCQNET